MRTVTGMKVIRSLVQAVSWHRRALAAVCAAAAVLALAAALTAPPEPSTRVTVAARDISTGATISAADLTTASVPDRLLPTRAVTDPGSITGRIATAGVTKGSVITEATSFSEGSSASAPGRLVVPVRVQDATAGRIVRPGQRIVLIASGSGTSPARILTRDAIVVTVPDGTASSAFTTGDTRGSVLLVDVDERTATEVAMAVSTTSIWIALT